MKTSFIFRFLMLGLMLTGAALTSHAQSVSDADLIIYYSFNEDSQQGDDVLDVSGNGNHGFLHGDDLQIVSGKVGGAMELPGDASQYISVREHMYAEPFAEITLAVWVKTSVRGMVASWDRSEFFRFAVGDDVGGNNGTTFVAFDTCCPCCHDWFGKTDVADDQWHHIAATFDGQMKRIYVDGKLDDQIEAPAEVIGAGAARFGFIGIGSEAPAFDANVGPTWAYNGLLDEFLLFHRPLSEDEIAHLATAPEDPFVDATTSVDPADKVSTTWGSLKSAYK